MKKLYWIFIIIFSVLGCATVPTKSGWKPKLISSQLNEGFLLQNIETKPQFFGSGISIKGDIVNNSGKDYDIAIFSICIYGENENLLGTKPFKLRSFKTGQSKKLSPMLMSTYICDSKIQYKNIKKYEIVFGEKKLATVNEEKPTNINSLLKSSHYKSGFFFDELVEKRKEDKKILKANYNEVFNELVEIISDIGNPIVAMDRDNGLIVTDYERRSSIGETWKDKYYIRVSRRANGEVQIGIKRQVAKKERDDTWKDKSSDGVIENWILDYIQALNIGSSSTPTTSKNE